jgi:hypothetical protein
MKRISLQHIPLAGAYLCQDCNAVGNSAMNCPACASTVLLGLAGVLDREEALEQTPVMFLHSATYEHSMAMVA